MRVILRGEREIKIKTPVSKKSTRRDSANNSLLFTINIKHLPSRSREFSFADIKRFLLLTCTSFHNICYDLLSAEASALIFLKASALNKCSTFTLSATVPAIIEVNSCTFFHTIKCLVFFPALSDSGRIALRPIRCYLHNACELNNKADCCVCFLFFTFRETRNKCNFAREEHTKYLKFLSALFYNAIIYSKFSLFKFCYNLQCNYNVCPH